MKCCAAKENAVFFRRDRPGAVPQSYGMRHIAGLNICRIRSGDEADMKARPAEIFAGSRVCVPAMRRSTSTGNLIPAEAYGETMTLVRKAGSALTARGNFAGSCGCIPGSGRFSEKRPAKDAAPRKSRILWRKRMMLGSSCVCYGKARRGGVFSGRPPLWGAALAAPGG